MGRRVVAETSWTVKTASSVANATNVSASMEQHLRCTHPLQLLHSIVSVLHCLSQTTHGKRTSRLAITTTITILTSRRWWHAVVRSIVCLYRSVVKFSRNGPERSFATCFWRSVPPPEIAVPPPKVIVPPPGNDVPSPFWVKSLKLLPPEVRF